MRIKFIIILTYTSISIAFSQEKTIQLNKNEILTIEIPENGKIENRVYTCNLFDWKITIPENYEITGKKSTEELENKGYDAAKKANPNLKINQHPTLLIGFERGKYNFFKSSYESLAGTKKMSVEEHKRFSEQLFIDTFSKIKNIKFEHSSTSNIKLGKYIFYKIQIRLYDPKNERLILTEDLYNTFINNHLFSVLINYTNEVDGMLLNYNFEKSLEK